MTGEDRMPVVCSRCWRVVRHLIDEEWNDFDFDFTDYHIRMDGAFEIEGCHLCQNTQ